MSDKKIVIAGYSGHAYVVTEAATLSGINLNYYTEKEEAQVNPYDLNYLGFEEDPSFFNQNKNVKFILGIGDNSIRLKLFEYLNTKKIEILNVIDPSSNLSDKLTIGKGNFISKNVCINPMVTIEDACIINTGAIIEHECTIKSGVHVAPGAVLAGNVSVGEQSFVGANTVVKEGVRIGSNTIIGAGTVVINDVPDNVKIVGNPGRII